MHGTVPENYFLSRIAILFDIFIHQSPIYYHYQLFIIWEDELDEKTTANLRLGPHQHLGITSRCMCVCIYTHKSKAMNIMNEWREQRYNDVRMIYDFNHLFLSIKQITRECNWWRSLSYSCLFLPVERSAWRVECCRTLSWTFFSYLSHLFLISCILLIYVRVIRGYSSWVLFVSICE